MHLFDVINLYISLYNFSQTLRWFDSSKFLEWLIIWNGWSIYHFLQADGAHWYQNTFNLNRTIISRGCRHHNSMNESRWEDESWVALIDYSVLCLDSSGAVAAAHTWASVVHTRDAQTPICLDAWTPPFDWIGLLMHHLTFKL